MLIEIQDRNLQELISEYRNKGRAAKGFRGIKSHFLNNFDDEELSHLLRDHQREPIELDEEVDFRDNVDFLLKFYSIIEIAILSGFVSPALNLKLIYEINEVLGNDTIQKYYNEYYPLLLPKVLHKDVNTLKKRRTHITDIRLEIFNQFLLTIKSIENDPDVEQFQWFLDNGYTEGFYIDDLIEVFQNEKSIKEYVQRRGRSRVISRAFRGYIKYINFLMDYKSLLDLAKEEDLLGSAIWHYQSYWFVKIKDKMSKILIDSLTQLTQLVNQVDQDKINGSKKDSISEDELDYSDWKKESNEILNMAIEDIKFLLNNKKLEIPLKKYALE